MKRKFDNIDYKNFILCSFYIMQNIKLSYISLYEIISAFYFTRFLSTNFHSVIHNSRTFAKS